MTEWIGENLQDDLGFPDKADGRAPPGTGWTPAELNNILHDHVVDGALTTFGCMEWESALFRGIMRARCYPFKMPERRFHSTNPQVCLLVKPLLVLTWYIHMTYTVHTMYIRSHTNDVHGTSSGYHTCCPPIPLLHRGGSKTWWAGSPLSLCFWQEMRLPQSLTSTVSARIQASLWAVPMQQR